MKRIILLVSVALIANFAHAQKGKADFGPYIGGAFYMGDVNHSKLFYSTSLFYGGMFRYSFNKRYALRLTAANATLTGSDLDFDNKYQQLRKHHFTTNITDMTAQIEFSFFPYLTENSEFVASPFIAFGGTLLISPAPATTTGMGFCVPMTVGFKFNLGGRWSAGLEWSFRKTFNDYIDQLENHEIDGANINYLRQRSYNNSPDWYSFAGVFILFKLFKDRHHCRAYGYQQREYK